MYHFLEGSIVLAVCVAVLWGFAFGVNVKGAHYELACPDSHCEVTVTHQQPARLSFARRASPVRLSSVAFGGAARP